MAKPFCLNDTKSDTDQFSSPVPLIGLYIAGATSVCILLMLVDTISGLCRKTRYIPCRFFSLNSVTLTLLGVATKLPVDLTSYMPSALDQLSKLTGTTMICICMGFMLPSLGASRESESISNLVALSIFVVTVFVNICIQMSTQVIFSFVIEHILILCLMLSLLVLLWHCIVLEIKNVKGFLTVRNRQLFEKGEETLMHRVKRWYLYSCMYNPQLLLCRLPPVMTAEITCVFCSLILLQAVYRSLALNNMVFCEGDSDYGWSMLAIIISQIVIVITGSLTIAFRWFALATHVTVINTHSGVDLKSGYFVLHEFSIVKIRAIKTWIIVFCQAFLNVGLLVMCLILFFILGSVPLVLSIVLSAFIEVFCPPLCQTIKGVSISSWKEEFRSVIDKNVEYDLPEWIMKVCVMDMNKWMKNASKKFASSSSMAEVLSRPRPSAQALLNNIQQIGMRHSNGYEVTCLSVVVLVKIVAASVSSSLMQSLREALDEAFEIIYFIDERIHVDNFEDRSRRKVAKILWQREDLLHLRETNLPEHDTSVDGALLRVEAACRIAPGMLMGTEIEIIRDFIQDLECTSTEELRDCIYQLFADMLHWFLTQFPNCILEEVHESSVEEYEERAKTVLKLLYKLEPSLEDKVQWSFPDGTNITRFFDHYENHDEGIPSDTTIGDAGAPATTTCSLPSTQDVELGTS